MTAVKLPAWLRIVMVSGAFLLAIGAGLFAYFWYIRPVTLTAAVGSLDGEADKVLSAIASRLTATSAPVRLRIVNQSGALEAANAFSSGKVDLAVVRGDVGDLSQAQAVLVLAHAVVLIVAPPGSPLTDVASLKGHRVGVVGGEINRSVVNALRQQYDLERANVKFRDLSLPEARQAVDARSVDALLLVIPLTPKYLSLARSLFPQNMKSQPVLIPIESADAIAESHRAYESFDVPKGTLRGSPAVPDDDLTTLRVSFYLVAQKKLNPDTIADLTRSLLAARRDLIGELPVLAQVTAPDTDPDAFLPVHAGASEYFNGTQEGFLDEWSNAIYLTPMILGGVASVLAAAWRFIGLRTPKPGESALDALYALARRVRKAQHEDELSDIESRIDDILSDQRLKIASGDEDAADMATLNVAANRVESLIHARRAMLSTS
ncbi:C4-dicarboxylate ABC transporter substrate-binding protein [Bradyrhizobium sp. NAS80.1]|uniref:TAXI family TRAP transporter solute-binding subunit n=1 Tax=Bradyrhizobium sp. NAS80.1 TaxID=1680159 RepID=UPI000966E0EB|nr:TAXI family TRAP transporter solute-binding subunit [Bradyrhizobium sp. NAS80.1]OKO87845.1 C4-dicarboxylate ABC transporter substrate-binding protein [Bradyrhizobium sp. NAS80.1]